MNKLVAIPVAAAVPVNVSALASCITTANAASDPILAAIERHKQAAKVCNETVTEIQRISRLADEQVGPLRITMFDMREPSSPPGFHPAVDAYCVSDIIQFCPGDEHAELRSHYVARLAAQSDARTEFLGDDIDAMMDGPATELWAAEEALAATVPTTMAGLLAMLVYAGEIVSADSSPILLDDQTGPIFVSSLAKAARSLRDQFP